MYTLFCNIVQCCKDRSNNIFHEILKCFRKTAKFDNFFVKQIMYLASPDHSQNDHHRMIFDMFIF